MWNPIPGARRWTQSACVDQYDATFATWFGFGQANLPLVLPNLGRFARSHLDFPG